LKIRGSYAQIGADAGTAFQYYPGYSFSSIAGGSVLNPGVLTLSMIPPGVINNNLTWINTKTANLGLDLELWRGELGITADIFQKNRDGLLATRASAVPSTFGATFPQENLNSDKVKGFELEVSHKNKIGNFNYSVSANVTYSRSYLLHVETSPPPTTWSIWKGSYGNGRITGNGTWLYTIDGTYTNVTQYETAPLTGGTNGNSKCLPGMLILRDVNGDGAINSNDVLPTNWARAVDPPLQYGLNANASWKGFDINMLLQGASMFSYFMGISDIWGYKSFPVAWDFYLDRWHTTDPKANPHDPSTQWMQGEWPALLNDWTGTTLGANTTQNNFNCSYLRIKNLEIGYTLPKKITRAIKIDNTRVFLNIVNAYTFCRKELQKFDPEREVGDYDQGITYPILREFNFGISINF